MNVRPTLIVVGCGVLPHQTLILMGWEKIARVRLVRLVQALSMWSTVRYERLGDEKYVRLD